MTTSLSDLRLGLVFQRGLYLVLSVKAHKEKYGGKSKKETPVTMPNTAVKLLHAESSWWETACEGRTLPCFFNIPA